MSQVYSQNIGFSYPSFQFFRVHPQDCFLQIVCQILKISSISCDQLSISLQYQSIQQKYQMQTDLRPVLPLSARVPHISRRTHSQPSSTGRPQTRIKINTKRLPLDFFHPSLPDIRTTQQPLSKRAATQEIRRSTKDKNDYQYATIEASRKLFQREFEGDREKDRRRRITSQHCINRQQSFQNYNMMNWTFSRQLFQQQPTKSTSLPKQPQKPQKTRIELTSPTAKAQPKQQVNTDGRASALRRANEVNSMLAEKLAEVNLNRLQLKVRKNNHPQPYLNFIKRCRL